MRYFVYFSYNGTAYHGWQFQPNAMSVQEQMESAFRTLLREPVILTAAGRTDTGVHARLMVAHFDLEETKSPDELKDLAFRLNGLLPEDISVHRIVPVQPTAHARFDATARTYEYWVTDVKNPYTNHLITYTRFNLDYDLMNRAAELLLETKDFASFCKAHSDNRTTLCHVRRAFWEQRPLPFMSPTTQNSHPHGLFTNLHTLNLQTENVAHVFTIESDRFLRNMVRAVVATHSPALIMDGWMDAVYDVEDITVK